LATGSEALANPGIRVGELDRKDGGSARGRVCAPSRKARDSDTEPGEPSDRPGKPSAVWSGKDSAPPTDRAPGVASGSLDKACARRSDKPGKVSGMPCATAWGRPGRVSDKPCATGSGTAKLCCGMEDVSDMPVPVPMGRRLPD
jgi:hypothetical protein